MTHARHIPQAIRCPRHSRRWWRARAAARRTAAAKEAPPRAPGTAGAPSSRVENGAPDGHVHHVRGGGRHPGQVPRRAREPRSTASSGQRQHQLRRVDGTAAFDGTSYLDLRRSRRGRRRPARSATTCPTPASAWSAPRAAPRSGATWRSRRPRSLRRTMPIIDASDAGIRLNVETTGVDGPRPPRRRPRRWARPRSTPTAPRAGTSRPRRWPAPWSAWRATGIVAVADHFEWLDYLTGDWRAVVRVRGRGRAGSAPGRRRRPARRSAP